MPLRVKLREDRFRAWIIVPAENESLAWSGTPWVPINRDGVPAATCYAIGEETIACAESMGYQTDLGQCFPIHL